MEPVYEERNYEFLTVQVLKKNVISRVEKCVLKNRSKPNKSITTITASCDRISYNARQFSYKVQETN